MHSFPSYLYLYFYLYLYLSIYRSNLPIYLSIHTHCKTAKGLKNAFYPINLYPSHLLALEFSLKTNLASRNHPIIRDAWTHIDTIIDKQFYWYYK